MIRAIFGQVLTAMVTPFDAQGRIDDAAVVRLVDHLLSHGSDGIVVCGTTGESPTLSYSEKLHLFRLVKDTADGRGTVVAGTGGNDTAASIVLTREAAEIGVDGALLVVPPCRVCSITFQPALPRTSRRRPRFGSRGRLGTWQPSKRLQDT